MKRSRPVSRCGHTGRRLVLAFTAIAAGTWTGAQADVVDIAWDANGRFEHDLTVAPAKFAEVCGKLNAGLKVRWDFKASAPLEFDVHYHVGKEVVFPAKLTSAAAIGVLDPEIDQDYCWKWSNKSAAAATITVKLRR